MTHLSPPDSVALRAEFINEFIKRPVPSLAQNDFSNFKIQNRYYLGHAPDFYQLSCFVTAIVLVF